MADISEVLLSINEVLQGYETEVKKAGAKVTVLQINGKERVEIREEIKEKLKKTRVNFEQKPVPESGFDGIELQETSSSILRIIFKTKGGGSGAGAAITELAESAQCVYAAVAFGLGRKITQSDITPKNVKAYENKFSVNGNLDKIMNQMTDEWMQSSVLGANELWEKFGSLRGVVFHRGDKTVDHIENQFKRIKKIEKIRIDINKWSPADIYITTPNYDPKCLQDEQSIRGLNQCMNERIDPKAPKMFGVSLKKMSGSSDLKLLNFDRKDASEKEFLKIEATQSSKDFYVVFKDGTKIQFRGFSGDNLSGWQGEVKGSKANQGKIGGGPVNLLLKIHGLDLVDIQVANKIKNKNQKVGVITKLKENLKSVLGNEYSERELANMQMTMTEKEFNSWLYSKSQGAELAKIITSISNTTKQNQLCEDLYLYANSRSSISAPYYKLE
jgi:hypothetical protein|tara:strand:- start:60 stop:1391 length:1332 start_codon:yes stop_codon:yes gene_type:complete